MPGVEKIIDDIAEASFFCAMGKVGEVAEGVIYVENVSRVFISPHDLDLPGDIEDLLWLPTSSTQDDPFNHFPAFPTELTALRLKVSKAVMQSIRQAPKSPFIAGAHDFSLAARNAACFAFRQYVTEDFFGNGAVWSEIVELYLSGRWPVGFMNGQIVVI